MNVFGYFIASMFITNGTVGAYTLEKCLAGRNAHLLLRYKKIIFEIKREYSTFLKWNNSWEVLIDQQMSTPKSPVQYLVAQLHLIFQRFIFY